MMIGGGLDNDDHEMGLSANFASDTNVNRSGRAYTEFNSPPDYGMSTSSVHQGKHNVVNSMQERNRLMRSDAKVQNHNLLLQDKIIEQQEEIKQLRQYLRDIFEQEEYKIVAASYEGYTETSM